MLDTEVYPFRQRNSISPYKYRPFKPAAAELNDKENQTPNRSKLEQSDKYIPDLLFGIAKNELSKKRKVSEMSVCSKSKLTREQKNQEQESFR